MVVDMPTVTFHITNAVTAIAQAMILFYVLAAYKRTREWGFGVIALATVIYLWNVAFHYLVQFRVVVPEALWSKRESDVVYALDAAVYISAPVSTSLVSQDCAESFSPRHVHDSHTV